MKYLLLMYANESESPKPLKNIKLLHKPGPIHSTRRMGTTLTLGL